MRYFKYLNFDMTASVCHGYYFMTNDMNKTKDGNTFSFYCLIINYLALRFNSYVNLRAYLAGIFVDTELKDNYIRFKNKPRI